MTVKQKIIYISLGVLLIPVAICAYTLLNSAPPVNEYRILFEGVVLGGWIIVEVAVLILISLYYSFAGAPPPRKVGKLKPKNFDPVAARRSRKIASYYHLAAGLVLLIGGSICFGGVALTGI